MIVPN